MERREGKIRKEKMILQKKIKQDYLCFYDGNLFHLTLETQFECIVNSFISSENCLFLL